MKRRKGDADRLLPLTVPVFQILLSLSRGRPMHGYAILTDILDRADTSVKLGAGTLYAAIKRMIADGLIETAQAPPGATSEGPRRRYYAITSFGRDVARAEAARLHRLTVFARERDLLADG